MKSITLEELLEAGCHFGHQVTRQNPKAREFIFEARDNIHIIDLAKTKSGLEEAAAFLKTVAQNPESTLLVVGTKRQAVPILEEILGTLPEDVKKSIFTVTKRWMGGTLTNTQALSKNYERLKELTEKIGSDEWKQKYTKKELGLFEKERQKYQTYYGGIVNMKGKPSALFVIDTHTEGLSVKEASRMGIPTVGIVDTNADPDLVDYVIPANDDAVGSLKLLIFYILGAWTEGKSQGAKEVSHAKDSNGNANDAKKEVSAKNAKPKESDDNVEATKSKASEAAKKVNKSPKES